MVLYCILSSSFVIVSLCVLEYDDGSSSSRNEEERSWERFGDYFRASFTFHNVFGFGLAFITAAYFSIRLRLGEIPAATGDDPDIEAAR